MFAKTDSGAKWQGGAFNCLTPSLTEVTWESRNGQLLELKINLELARRGEEKLMENRDLRQGLSLVGRPGLLTPSAFEIAFAEACEQLLGLEVPRRAIELRELVRLTQLVSGRCFQLAGLAESAGADLEPWLTAREAWLNFHNQLTGARIHDCYARIGGVGADLPEHGLELPPLELPKIDWARVWQGMGTWKNESGNPAMPEGVSDATARAEWLWSTLQSSQAQIVDLLGNLSPGEIQASLPKSIRLPQGSAAAEAVGAFGRCRVWVFGNGNPTPLRIHLNSDSETLLSQLISSAAGQSEETVDLWLTTLPISATEAAL